MNKILILGFLTCLAAACSEEPADSASSPSPLLTADSDRLWILLRASRVGDGRVCKELYLQADDPRYQGRIQQCDFWTRDYADYLRINGFPTIEHQHLKEPAYWKWYLDKRGAISDCKTAIGNVCLRATSAESAEHTRRRRACDPYDDARNNQDLTPADLRIRFN